MPGFLGGSSSGSGAGGEVTLGKEFIDPVTKIRVSTPENLIDTDFEYGLQPTKWETVELINNTPSFFSKSGDTTIPDIISITTNDGTREITVLTGLPHNLSVGIPISVSGTKSITADGSFIINSIPNANTFTYLCKDNQITTSSIEDLYSSIITGEFFQGSQLRIASSEGIVTDGEAVSTLTVKTESTHGFGINTPFYFLNLNSTIAQEFASANTETKSFDSSNSAVAQTFDGSNTLTTINIDWSNSAVVGGVVSTISSVNVNAETITVAHGTENFSGKVLGTPLYYDVQTSSGYFATNPRGVVYLKTIDTLGISTSTFQVSAVPDGTPINLESSMTGIFQLANQARTFAGNNINPVTQTTLTIVNDTPKQFNASNSTGEVATVTGYSAGNVTVSAAAVLPWYSGSMLLYTTTGSAASGLQNNVTYWVDNIFQQGTSLNFVMTLRATPTGSVITSISGGTGTQTFTSIGVSLDKDVFHIKDNGYTQYDMLRYAHPVDGKFQVATQDQNKEYYFVSLVYDSHNFQINETVGELQPLIQAREGTFTYTAITPTVCTPIGLIAPITFAITSGTLPGGLVFSSSTGVISGTPTEPIAVPGRDVVVTATDSTGSIAFQTIRFQFNPAPQLYEFSSVTFTPGGGDQHTGPTVAQARSGAGNPPWANQYINMPGNQGTIHWTVPKAGTYRIQANGPGRQYDNYFGYYGGYGAFTRGDFTLAQGQVLRIMVGQYGVSTSGNQGNHSIGGGSGGTFVVKETGSSESDILVIAGGGMTPGYYPPCGGNVGGQDATGNNPNGQTGGFGQGGGGGSGGGAGGNYYGSGGAGFRGNQNSPDGNYGPNSFLNGGRGGYMDQRWGWRGALGGFGGGGGAGLNSGGSGGYSGGGAGQWCSYLGGGGGGSYNNGANQSNGNGNSSQGSVVINFI
jgi:hypothetical protein